MLSRFGGDLRLAARSLLKAPGLAAVAVLTLALGIGGTTAMFTVGNALLLEPLPYRNPQRLRLIYQAASPDVSQMGEFSLPRFRLMLAGQRSFDGLAAFTTDTFAMTGRGLARQLAAARVSWNFFDVLGVRPTQGRDFSANEGQPGGQRVVLLSHSFWLQEFGGAGSAVGSTLELNGHSFAIAGVLPAGFRFQPLGAQPDIWVPRIFALNVDSTENLERGVGYLVSVGRLAQGMTSARAQADMDVLNQAYVRAHPAFSDADVHRPMEVRPLDAMVVADFRPALLLLMGAVGLVLLIACANVASLLLARAVKRRREIATRVALGASAADVIRQLLTESLFLAVLGGAAGFGLGAALLHAMLALSPTDGPLTTVAPIAIDLPVLLFTVAVCLLSALVFGLAPALQLARTDPALALRETGAGGSAGCGGFRSHAALVVGQVALAALLVTGAGLLLHSFSRLLRVQPGFNPTHVLTLQINLPPGNYPNGARMTAFANALIERTSALPGVRAAAVTSALPLNATRLAPILAEDQPALPLSQRPLVYFQTITPDYPAVFGVPVARGRAFTAADNQTTLTIAIVNQTFARRYWPGTDPIGKRIWVAAFLQPVRVVGVFGDVRNHALDAAPRPEMFIPFPNLPWGYLHLSVRTGGAAMAVAPAVRASLAALDSNLPATHVQSLNQLVAGARAQPRFTAALLAGLSGLALALAVIGIYGVISYTVAQRTREFGIRMALGAGRGTVLRAVVAQALALTAAGVALGLGAALLLAPMLSSLLFQVQPSDPATLAATAALFLGVAFAASLVPARRAQRLDPAQTLRQG